MSCNPPSRSRSRRVSWADRTRHQCQNGHRSEPTAFALKKHAKSLLRRFGYDIRQVPRPTHLDGEIKDVEYYRWWSPPYLLFAPWVGYPTFERLYAGIERHTIVPRDRCYVLASLTAHASHLEGDLAECGVHTGGTALLMCRASAGSRKRLYLFDSFEGLPEVDPQKDVGFEKGQFAVDDVASVERLLSDFDDVTEIRKGWIPETFAGLEDRTVRLCTPRC